ncbi:MAG: hypothetical protein ACFFFO_08940 [Candidatus Thorarchaeota archaeon]
MTSRIVETIKVVLKQSKEDNEVTNISSDDAKLLIQFGFPNSTPFVIDRSQRINLAFNAVTHGASFSEIVDLLTWKDFEGFVAGILSENNYRCVESFRRRGTALIQGMEIDVVGVKGRTIVSVDAKMWGIRGGKTSALKNAAEKQKNRTSELASELDGLTKKLSLLPDGVYTIYPTIVTWLVEEVELHEGVPVVPITKWNSFILDLEQYEDIIVTYSGQLKS